MKPPDTFDPQQLDQDALLKQLGMGSAESGYGEGGVTNPAYQADPRTAADLATNRAAGESAGNDMSWMDTPGATTVRPPTSNTMPIGGTPSFWEGPDGNHKDVMTADDLKSSLTPKSSVQPSVFQGFTPKYAMEGFDWNREQNTGKSAKDAFAYLANQAPPPPLNDKAALGQWFEQYIRPGMDQLGHTVKSVNGDSFTYGNHEGDFTVDYGRGAGADGGALAWQAESAGWTPRAYVPRGTSTTADTSTALSDQPSTQEQLQAEIEALINGGNSPMDEQTLMALLQQGQP